MTQQFGAKSTADEVLSDLDLSKKRFLITGASSGIGLETARALAARGANVVGTVRNLQKAQQSTAPAHASAAHSHGSVKLIELDLASLQSVRAAADALLAQTQPFDAIIANAGVMATPFARTEDGIEIQFATNYLGHFALLLNIHPLLADGGRLVALSSQAHRISDIDLDDLNFERTTYDPWLAYARSKTATALWAVQFDRLYRHRGIRAASVMPGNSFTGLTAHFSQDELQKLFEAVGKARAEANLPPAELKEVTQAAATPVWAAVVADQEAIGGRYLEDCSVAIIDDTPNPFADGVRSYALDSEKARNLWEKTEQLLSAIS